MKAPRSRAARSAAVMTLALATFLTAGCGANPGPGVAAVSDGQVIRESDLDAIVADFAKVDGAQSPTRAEMVSLLVARPYLMKVLASKGVMNEAGVRQILGKDVPQVSEPTVQLFQAAMAQRQIDPATDQTLRQQMAAGDIEIAPRYGSFEAGKGLTAATPNWLAPAKGATAEPTAP